MKHTAFKSDSQKESTELISGLLPSSLCIVPTMNDDGEVQFFKRYIEGYGLVLVDSDGDIALVGIAGDLGYKAVVIYKSDISSRRSEIVRHLTANSI